MDAINWSAKGSPRVSFGDPHSFICLQKALIHTFIRLTIKRTEELRVPQLGRFFAGGVPLALLRLARVDEVVGVAITQGPAHDERAFPWRGQLVLACLLLDESEVEVAFTECERLDLLAVVVPQALLVDSRAAKCQKARLFEWSTPSSRASLASALVYIVTRGESNSTSVGMMASDL